MRALRRLSPERDERCSLFNVRNNARPSASDFVDTKLSVGAKISLIGDGVFRLGFVEIRVVLDLNQFAARAARAPVGNERLERLTASEGAFRDATQARMLLDLLFVRLLPAYRGFHADLLEHQPPGGLERPFFLMAAAQALLADDAMHPDHDATVRRAISMFSSRRSSTIFWSEWGCLGSSPATICLMWFFTASLATETNTFSPMLTSRTEFEESFYAPAGKHPDYPKLFTAPLAAARYAADVRSRAFPTDDQVYRPKK